jgi:hypothetical protein
LRNGSHAQVFIWLIQKLISEWANLGYSDSFTKKLFFN